MKMVFISRAVAQSKYSGETEDRIMAHVGRLSMTKRINARDVLWRFKSDMYG